MIYPKIMENMTSTQIHFSYNRIDRHGQGTDKWVENMCY